jgi:transcription initiation factor TFIIB
VPSGDGRDEGRDGRRKREREREGERSTGTDEPACPECGAPTVDDGSAHREVVCDDCGLVVETRYIDRGPEWRAGSYDEYESKARTGKPTSKVRHDEGLTTVIDWRDRDHAGNALSSTGRRRVNRLRRWQARIRTQGRSERTLRSVLGEVTRMSSALDLPEPTREVAAAVCQRAAEEDLFRGRSVEGVASGALYAACGRTGAPRSLDEVTEVSRVDRLEVGRTFRYLARELGLDVEPSHPRQYLARFCSELELPESVLRRARTVVDRTADAGLVSGKSPTGYAGAAVLVAALVAGENASDRRVAEVADVTRVTVRTHARDQLEELGSPAIADGLVRDDRDPPPGWRDILDPAPGTAGPDGRAMERC